MDLDYALRVAVHQLHSRRLMFRPVRIPGFPTFPDRQSLVAYLAGPTPSGTPERAGQQYRTAARRIQRWERGETTPSVESTYRLDAFAARLQRRRVAVDLSACIRVSSEKVCRWREHMRATITEFGLGSPDAFIPEFFPAYGIGFGVRVDDVGEMSVQYV